MCINKKYLHLIGELASAESESEESLMPTEVGRGLQGSHGGNFSFRRSAGGALDGDPVSAELETAGGRPARVSSLAGGGGRLSGPPPGAGHR